MNRNARSMFGGDSCNASRITLASSSAISVRMRHHLATSTVFPGRSAAIARLTRVSRSLLQEAVLISSGSTNFSSL